MQFRFNVCVHREQMCARIDCKYNKFSNLVKRDDGGYCVWGGKERFWSLDSIWELSPEKKKPAQFVHRKSAQ